MFEIWEIFRNKLKKNSVPEIVLTFHCLNKLFKWSQKFWSLEQFFLTVDQNNFGNKIPLFHWCHKMSERSKKCWCGCHSYEFQKLGIYGEMKYVPSLIYQKKTYKKLQSLLLLQVKKFLQLYSMYIPSALVVRRIKNISECTKLQNIVSKQNFSSIFRRRVEVQLKDKIRFSQVTSAFSFRFGFSSFHSV